MKTLNTTESKNRFRFENLSERLRKINVDVVHRVDTKKQTQDPFSGEKGCFFQDELESCKHITSNRRFMKFYGQVWPLSQSLAELIHHRETIKTLLLSQFQILPQSEYGPYFSLLGVFARDLKEDLHPSFHEIMQKLLPLVDVVAGTKSTSEEPSLFLSNPEMAGKLFEAISHLMKNQLSQLSLDPDSLRKYYGPLLGHPTPFIRSFAARSLSLILRRTKPSTLRSHLKGVMKALSSSCTQALAQDKAADSALPILSLPVLPLEASRHLEPSLLALLTESFPHRFSDLLDGFSDLLFYALKGVRGCLHTTAIPKLQILFEFLLPFPPDQFDKLKVLSESQCRSEDKKDGKGKKSGKEKSPSSISLSLSSDELRSLVSKREASLIPLMLVSGRVLSHCLPRLLRHPHPSSPALAEVWTCILNLASSLTSQRRVLRPITDLPASVLSALNLSSHYGLELLLFALSHSNYRGLSHTPTMRLVTLPLLQASLDLCLDCCMEESQVSHLCPLLSLPERARLLFCKLWARFPTHPRLLSLGPGLVTSISRSLSPSPGAVLLTRELLPCLPAHISHRHLLRPVLQALNLLSADGSDPGLWLSTFHDILVKMGDSRSASHPSEDPHQSLTLAKSASKVGPEGWGYDEQEEGSGDEDSDDDQDEEDDQKKLVSFHKSRHSLSSSSLQSVLDTCGESIPSLLTSTLSFALSHPFLASQTFSSSLSPDPSLIIAFRVLNWFVAYSPTSLLPLALSTASPSLPALLRSLTLIINIFQPSSASLPQFSPHLPLLSSIFDLYFSLLASPSLSAQIPLLPSSLPPNSSSTSDPKSKKSKKSSNPSPSAAPSIQVSVEGLERSGVHSLCSLLCLQPRSIAIASSLLAFLERRSALLSQKDEANQPKDSRELLSSLLPPSLFSSLFNSLSSTLSSPSYWLKIIVLRILSFFPLAQLLSPSALPSSSSSSSSSETGNKKGKKDSRTPTSSVLVSKPQEAGADVCVICLEALQLPLALSSEREFSRRVQTLEVLVRSERLPAPFLSLLCAFSVGMLHQKFRPFWEPCIQLMAAICGSSTDKEQEEGQSGSKLCGEDLLWPHLTLLLEPPLPAPVPTLGSDTSQSYLKSASAYDDGSVSIPPFLTRSSSFPLRLSSPSLISTGLTLDEEAEEEKERERTKLALLTEEEDEEEENGGRNEVSVSQSSQFRSSSDVPVLVFVDSRADAETVHLTAWEVLKRCPALTLNRSRVIVPIFLRFLQTFYQFFNNEPEVPLLISVGILPRPSQSSLPPLDPSLSVSILRTRLSTFLGVFSSLTSPRQLFQHQLLFLFFFTQISRPEVSLSRQALDCLLTFRPRYLVPYRENLTRLLDDKQIREELLRLDLSPSAFALNYSSSSSSGSLEIFGEDGTEDSESSSDPSQVDLPYSQRKKDTDQLAPLSLHPSHRSDFLPLLISLLCGRFLAKGKGGKAKDINLARKSAALTFLSRLSASELRPFLQYMLRGILPFPRLLSSLPTYSLSEKSGPSSLHFNLATLSLSQPLSQWFDFMDSQVMSLAPQDFTAVAWERQAGFLHLLEEAVKVLGFGLTPYVPALMRVLVCMLSHAQSRRDEAIQRKKGLEIEDCEELEELDEEVEEQTEDSPDRILNQASRVRGLCLLRLIDLMNQFHASFDFTSFLDPIFASLSSLIELLPSTLSSSASNSHRSTPVLLRFFSTLISHPETLPHFLSRDSLLRSLISCLGTRLEGSQAAFNISRIVSDSVLSVLDSDKGTRGSQSVLYRHGALLINTFCLRFGGSEFNPESDQLGLADLRFAPSTSGAFKQEISILCQVAERLFLSGEMKVKLIDDSEAQKPSRSEDVLQIHRRSLANLSTLLLLMIRSYSLSRKLKVEASWLINLLRTYRALIGQVGDVCPHVPFLSRFFGPSLTPYSLFNTLPVRQVLLEVYTTLAEHPSTQSLLNPSSLALSDLMALDKTSLSAEEGSRDFERCVAVFQRLSEEREVVPKASIPSTSIPISWSAVLGPALLRPAPVQVTQTQNTNKSKKGKKNQSMAETPVSVPPPIPEEKGHSLCLAVLFECLRCMQDQELVIRHAALAALKRLVECVIDWSEISNPDQSEFPFIHWLNPLTAILVPSIRNILKNPPSHQVKTDFIALLSHIVLKVGSTEYGRSRPDSFHSDLLSLWNEDPEQSFFENIAHIQLHRRIRAMTRLRKLLESALPPTLSTSSQQKLSYLPPFSKASLVHILLSLAIDPIFSLEYVKKDQQALSFEAVGLLSALASHLPWSQYYQTIKLILKRLDKHDRDKEKVLLTALCSTLQSFHFDMTGEVEDSEEQGQGTEETHPQPEGLEGETEVEGEIEIVLEGEGEEEDLVKSEMQAEEIQSEPTRPKSDAISVLHGCPQSSTIVKVVLSSLLPWVKVFLLKEEKDHKGEPTKVVRTMVAVALAQLIQRLQPPSVSQHRKDGLLSNLLITVIGTFKSRDSKVRDVARESLVKIVDTLGMENSLERVIYELQHNLTVGYQRHVSCFTIRSLLTHSMENYVPPTNVPSAPLVFSSESSSPVPPSRSKTTTELQDDKKQQEQSSLFQDFVQPPFDKCVPLIIQSVLDDLVGDLREDREVVDVDRSLIREAKGSKSKDILEVVAKCILFRPTYALHAPSLGRAVESVSSIHALTTPLLHSLGDEENRDKTNKISEALQSIANGLSRNPSVDSQELLLYLHATLHPFVVSAVKSHEQHKQSLGMLKGKHNKAKTSDPSDVFDGDDDLNDDDLPSYLREDSSDEETAALYSNKHKKSTRGDNVTGYRAATWLPSDRNRLGSQAAVLEAQRREREQLHKVQDGASAPRLTGSTLKRSRTDRSKEKDQVTAVSLSAVRFCLTVFNTALKNNKLDSEDPQIRSMVLPFLPILGQCLRFGQSVQVVANAMRCLCSVLSWGLEVKPQFSRAVGSRMLKTMFQGEVLVSSDSDLVQACLKGLASLFQLYRSKKEKQQELKELKNETLLMNEEELLNLSKSASTSVTLPLSEPKIQQLLRLLALSITEVTSSFQTPAFQLIKSILDSKLVFAEMYDLMTKVMEQMVLSQRKGIRDAALALTLNFLLNYPLSNKRLTGHLKQLVSNCSYQFQDGRMTALECLSSLGRLLPSPVLNDSSSILFLPLTLRLVNDVASVCREKVSEVLTTLARRSDPDAYAQYFSFGVKWLESSQSLLSASESSHQCKALFRTGAQVLSILISARPELAKKKGGVPQLVSSIRSSVCKLLLASGHFQPRGSHLSQASKTRSATLESQEMSQFEERQGDEDKGLDLWVLLYYSLSLLERLMSQLSTTTDQSLTHPESLDEETRMALTKYIYSHSPRDSASQAPPLMELVQEALLFPHAWVRAVAVRVSCLYLSRRDVTRDRLSPPSSTAFSSSSPLVEVLLLPNGLFQFSRRICLMLNLSSLPLEVMRGAVQCLVFLVRALIRNPDLCQGAVEDDDVDEEAEQNLNSPSEVDGEQEEAEGLGEEVEGFMNRVSHPSSSIKKTERDLDSGPDEESEEGPLSEASDEEREEDDSSMPQTAVLDLQTKREKGGADWVMERLRRIGASPKGRRRLHVLSVFSLLLDEGLHFLENHLEQLIEVCLRAIQSSEVPPDPSTDNDPYPSVKEIANELLQALENKVGAATFLGQMGKVQSHLREGKTMRKQQAKILAVSNPAEFAIQKSNKTRMKKEAKKRKTMAHMAIRGLGKPKKVKKAEFEW